MAIDQYLAAINKVSSKFRHIAPKESLKWATEKQHLLTLIQKKELREATPDSLADALLQSASMGLSLNPTLGHCYLIPRRERKREQRENWEEYKSNVPVIAYASPSYKGLINLSVSTGKIRFARAEVVFQGDFFRYFGPTAKPEYEANLKAIRDPEHVLGVWAEAKTQEGDWLAEFMDWKTVLAIRNRSDMKDGLMWNLKGQFWTEGAKKAVLRRLYKTIPHVSPLIDRATELMNQYESIDTNVIEGEVERIHSINEQQSKNLNTLLKNMPEDQATKWLNRLANRFGVKDYVDIPANDYEDAYKILESAIGKPTE